MALGFTKRPEFAIVLRRTILFDAIEYQRQIQPRPIYDRPEAP